MYSLAHWLLVGSEERETRMEAIQAMAFWAQVSGFSADQNGNQNGNYRIFGGCIKATIGVHSKF